MFEVLRPREGDQALPGCAQFLRYTARDYRADQTGRRQLAGEDDNLTPLMGYRTSAGVQFAPAYDRLFVERIKFGEPFWPRKRPFVNVVSPRCKPVRLCRGLNGLRLRPTPTGCCLAIVMSSRKGPGEIHEATKELSFFVGESRINDDCQTDYLS